MNEEYWLNDNAIPEPPKYNNCWSRDRNISHLRDVQLSRAVLQNTALLLDVLRLAYTCAETKGIQSEGIWKYMPPGGLRPVRHFLTRMAALLFDFIINHAFLWTLLVVFLFVVNTELRRKIKCFVLNWKDERRSIMKCCMYIEFYRNSVSSPMQSMRVHFSNI